MKRLHRVSAKLVDGDTGSKAVQVQIEMPRRMLTIISVVKNFHKNFSAL